MSTERLYKVTAKKESTPKHRLIKAANISQVTRHLTADMFEIEPASPMDVAELFASNGGKLAVESAAGGEE